MENQREPGGLQIVIFYFQLCEFVRQEDASSLGFLISFCVVFLFVRASADKHKIRPYCSSSLSCVFS